MLVIGRKDLDRVVDALRDALVSLRDCSPRRHRVVMPATGDTELDRAACAAIAQLCGVHTVVPSDIIFMSGPGTTGWPPPAEDKVDAG